MQLIVLTGLPEKEKGWLTRDLADHFVCNGKRVAVLDNANISSELGALAEQIQIVTMRGGCACCAVADKLYRTAAQLSDTVDVAIMAANNQTHVGNLGVVLDNMVEGNRTPIDVRTVALVDDRTTCCFPYMAETLEENADVTLTAPFSVATLIAHLT